MRLPILIAVAAALGSAQSGGGYLITTVVDATGSEGFSGDGGPATAAQLNFPTGVAADAAGNLFMADTFNNRIRKVSASGTITTVAGTGVRGFGGDGGPATAAQLNYPQGVAVDAIGNLFIADTGNMLIRKVSANGIVTTVAGNSAAIAAALVAPGFSGDGGPATAAQLSSPKGLAVDALGNLFVADTGNQRIRKVSGGIITTVAGGGTLGPADDGGPATAAQLYNPVGVAVDTSGSLFIAGTSDSRIRKVSAGGIITTVAGTSTQAFGGDGGPATAAWLYEPWGVATDAAGNLFIADAGNQRIRRVSADGIITTIAGTGIQAFGGDGGPATAAPLEVLFAIGTDPNGNLFVSTGNRVRELLSPQLSPGCQFTINPSQKAFATAGGSASVSIQASPSTCPWRALSLANWVAFGGGGTGSGSGPIAYTVARNPYSADRTATLWIGGQFLTVTQAGLTCSLTVPARNLSVSAFGFAGAVVPLSFDSPDCPWTATTSASWILLGSPSSGTGNGSFAYSVGINTGPLRTGTITVSGRTLYVNQPAQGDSVTSLAGIADGGVVNAASGAGPIAPGSFVAIYGQNLADAAATWDSAITDGKTLPTALGGVQVQINGRKAFVYYVSPGQVNVLAPPDSTTGSVDVDVATNHGTAAASASLAAVSPAFFAYTLQGKLYPVTFFANANVQVAAVGALSGATSRPAAAGDYLTLYATGLGQTDPPYPAGQVLPWAYPIADLSQVQILFGGQPAKVLWAGMTFAGVFQINVQVPVGVASGEQPVVLTIGAQSSPQATVLPFQ